MTTENPPGLSDEVREEWARALCAIEWKDSPDPDPFQRDDPVGREVWRMRADALAPLIRQERARGAAAVVERVESLLTGDYANNKHVAGYAVVRVIDVHAALTTEADQ